MLNWIWCCDGVKRTSQHIGAESWKNWLISCNSFTELLRLCILCANTSIISHSCYILIRFVKNDGKFSTFFLYSDAFESYWKEKRNLEKNVQKESKSFVKISFCCLNVVIFVCSQWTILSMGKYEEVVVYSFESFANK